MPHAKFLDTYDVIQFSIYPEDKQVICWISQEALADHFGATRESAVQILLGNMDRIAPVAEKVYRATPSGELVLVKTANF